MRILFLCNKLTDGGAERVCVCWANGLVRRGHEVSIYTDLTDEITYQPDEKVILIQNRGIFSNNFFIRRWYYFKDLRNLLVKEKIDVVISVSHFYTFSTWLITKLCGKGIRILMTEHNAFDRPSFRALTKREYIEKFILNRLWDHVTVLTQADKDFIGDRLKKVTVLPNPLFLEPVKSVPTDKEKIILAVGRMDVWRTKGFDLLINAWNAIGSKYQDWTLRIVGSGTKKNIDYLKSLVMPGTNVEFLPYTKDIQEEYRNAEVFVLSSRNEGFGLVLIEAMSQGCACLASDYKGRQAEIVSHGYNGEIVNYDDVEAMAKGIENIVKNPDVRKKYQENAIVSLDRYKIDNVINNLESLCYSVLNK